MFFLKQLTIYLNASVFKKVSKPKLLIIDFITKLYLEHKYFF